ncbi:MAG: CRISPR-associated protein Cas4 [Thermoplasmataceae archaeon]
MIAGFVVLILILIVVFSKKRQVYSIPAGRAIYGDLQSEGKVLISRRYGLTGKPDRVIRKGEEIIPYEFKSTESDTPRSGHLLQMGVYFIILEENYPGAVIKKGVLKYRSRAFEIRNTPELRERVLRMAELMRSIRGVPRRNHENTGRCFKCSFKEVCSQRLIK